MASSRCLNARTWKRDRSPLASISFGNSNVEECCLTREDESILSEHGNIDHNHCLLGDTGLIKGITCGVSEPIKSRKRFFKSSGRRRSKANKEMLVQESYESGGFDVTNEEIFYPDCNLSQLIRIEDGKIKIKREWKKIFKIVEHVRESHLIHEIGEDQEFKDDLDYFIDGISGEHSQKVRVQSALNLVKKSAQAEFRSFLRASLSTADLIKMFDGFHSNQKLSLCYCCLMMILIKSYPQDDYVPIISQLIVLHDTKYPIPDKETLKMIDVLKDSCNSVKEKFSYSKNENWTLFSRDIQVSALSEILILMLSLRDEKLLELPQVIKIILGTVDKCLCNVTNSWNEVHPLYSEDVFCKSRLYVKLSLVSKWLKIANTDNIKAFIGKEFIQNLQSTCYMSIKTCVSFESREECEILENKVNFYNVFVEILQCLGQIILKDIKKHLLTFQNNFYEHLMLFILFLDSQSELPQFFDLMILSLEMLINLTRVNPKFVQVLKKNLSDKIQSYESCQTGIQCLAKLFAKNYKSLMTKVTAGKKITSGERLNFSRCWETDSESTNVCFNLSGDNDSPSSFSFVLKNAEHSMISFTSTSYVAALIGIASYQYPKLMDNFLHLLPGTGFDSVCCILEDFLQFMLENGVHHLHHFLASIITFFKNCQK